MNRLSSVYRKDTFIKLLLVVGGVGLLLLTLYMLHYWLLLILVEGGLAPWDYGFERPSSNGWQQIVNNYFTGPPGENIPSVIVVTTMALLFIFRYRRDQNTLLPLEFGLLNITFVLGGSLITTLTMGVYRPLIWWITPDHQQGFHVTWPNIVISLFVLLCLFYSQVNGWLFRKIHGQPALQVVALILAISTAWFLCGSSITYQLLTNR